MDEFWPFLFILDTGNNRILKFEPTAFWTKNAAGSVFGQAGAGRNDVHANQKTVDANGFEVVSCIAVGRRHLVVGDKWNSRVLVYDKNDLTRGPIAAVGQPSLTSHCAGYRPGWSCRPTAANTLNLVAGCAIDSEDRLYVASTLENRVLVWNAVPTYSDAPADYVIGQDVFGSKEANTGAQGEGWISSPASLATSRSQLLVADNGNSRVLVFDLPIQRNRPSAKVVIGQPDFQSRTNTSSSPKSRLGWIGGLVVDQRGRLFIKRGGASLFMYDQVPSINGAEATLSFGGERQEVLDEVRPWSGAPLGLAAFDGWLFVLDERANRVLGYDADLLYEGASAHRVVGQRNFTAAANAVFAPGAKRYGNLIGPTAVAADETAVFIAENGAHRITRIPRSDFDSHSFVKARMQDAPCLSYDPTRYFSTAVDRWRRRMAGNLPKTGAYQARGVPDLDCLLSQKGNEAIAGALLARHGWAPPGYIHWQEADRQRLRSSFAKAWTWYENSFEGTPHEGLTNTPTNILADRHPYTAPSLPT